MEFLERWEYPFSKSKRIVIGKYEWASSHSSRPSLCLVLCAETSLYPYLLCWGKVEVFLHLLSFISWFVHHPYMHILWFLWMWFDWWRYRIQISWFVMKLDEEWLFGEEFMRFESVLCIDYDWFYGNSHVILADLIPKM